MNSSKGSAGGSGGSGNNNTNNCNGDGAAGGSDFRSPEGLESQQHQSQEWNPSVIQAPSKTKLLVPIVRSKVRPEEETVRSKSKSKSKTKPEVHQERHPFAPTAQKKHQVVPIVRSKVEEVTTVGENPSVIKAVPPKKKQIVRFVFSSKAGDGDGDGEGGIEGEGAASKQSPRDVDVVANGSSELEHGPAGHAHGLQHKKTRQSSSSGGERLPTSTSPMSSPRSSYKTLDEFLRMPPSHIPPKKHKAIAVLEQKESSTSNNSKRKSQLPVRIGSKTDSSQKKNEVEKEKEKSKFYDPVVVHEYMEKQRESRKEKELESHRVQKELLEKKKKQLQELNEKCRTLAKQSKMKAEAAETKNAMRLEVDALVNQAVSVPSIQPKRKSLSNVQSLHKSPSKSKSLSLSKSKLMHRSSTTLTLTLHSSPSKIKKASPAKQRASLLQEFEAIVKRECKTFFEGKKIQVLAGSSPKILTDKGVETTQSLFVEPDPSEKRRPRRPSVSVTSVENGVRSSKDKKTVKKTTPDRAASKIQAMFKGYQARKIMKEAHILPKDIVHMKALLNLRTDKTFLLNKALCPEKPYDSITKSPYFQRQLFREKVEVHKQPSVTSTMQSMSRSSLPSFQAITPTPLAKSRKSFNEPYPKEALQRMQEVQAQQSEAASLSRRNSFTGIKEVLFSDPAKRRSFECSGFQSPVSKLDLTPRRKSKGALNARRQSENFGIELANAPSISAVLMEKLRLLDLDKKRAKAAQIQTQELKAPVIEDMDDEVSISSISFGSGSQKQHDLSGIPDDDITITDDYFGPSADSSKRRTWTSTPITSVAQSQKQQPTKQTVYSKEYDSSTTVDTDADLIEDSRRKKKARRKTDISTDSAKETDDVSESCNHTLTPTSYPTPIIKLAYEAEREKLHVLKTAITATTNYEALQRAKQNAVPTKTEIEQIARRAAEQEIKANIKKLRREQESNKHRESELAQALQMQPSATSLQVAMIQCQQEAAKATTEISKWMMELQKSMQDDRQKHRERVMEEPINITAIVRAAVQEAQRSIEIERKSKEEERNRHLEQTQNSFEGFQPPPNAYFKPIISQHDVSLQFPSRMSSSSHHSSSTTLNSEREDVDVNENKVSEHAIEENVDVDQSAISISRLVEKDSSELRIDDSVELPAVEISSLVEQVEEIETKSRLEEISILSTSTPPSIIEEDIQQQQSQEDIQMQQMVSEEDEQSSKSSTPSHSRVSLSETLLRLEAEKDVSLGAPGAYSEKYTESFISDIDEEVDVDYEAAITSGRDYQEDELEQKEEESLKVNEDAKEEEASEKSELLDTSQQQERVEEEIRELQAQNSTPSPIDVSHSTVEELIVEREFSEPKNDDSVQIPATETVLLEQEEGKEEDGTKNRLEEIPVLPKPPMIAEDNQLQPQEDIQIVQKQAASEEEEQISKSSTASRVSLSENLLRLEAEADKDASLGASEDHSEKYSESFVSDFEKEGDSEVAAVPSASGRDNQEDEEEQKQDTSLKVEEDTKEDEAEAIEKSELLEIAQQQERVEEEIRELQAQISPPVPSPIDAYLTALEEQDSSNKPPPPYSFTTPDLERAEAIGIILPESKIEAIISDQVTQAWESWALTGTVGELSPELDEYVARNLTGDKKDVEEEVDYDEEDEDEMLRKFETYLYENATVGVIALVRECIEEALFVKQLCTDMGYIDTIRKGLYAADILKHKQPKTKAALLIEVRRLFRKYHFDNEEADREMNQVLSEKWSCRPRDIVENMLAVETVREEPLWLDIWPEALLLTDELSEKIVADSVKDVLHNFKLAFATDQTKI